MHDVAVADDVGAPGEAGLGQAGAQLLLQRAPPHEHGVGARVDSDRRGEVGIAAPAVNGAQLAPGAHDLVRYLLDAQRVGGDRPVGERVRPLTLALQRFDARQRIAGLQHGAGHRLGALPLGDARQPRVNRLRPGLERDDEPGREHRLARFVAHHRARACRDDDVPPVGELGYDGALHLAERSLAVLVEDALDLLARALDDALVSVGELPAEQPRDTAPDGALAGAGEANEEDAVAGYERTLARTSASPMVTASKPRARPGGYAVAGWRFGPRPAT